MSKEFLDRLARGQLTNTRDYRCMQDRLKDATSPVGERGPAEQGEKPDSADNQEWKNWELSPVWSPSDRADISSEDKRRQQAEESIRADGVHRALAQLDKNSR